jgi:hypothetical protein
MLQVKLYYAKANADAWGSMIAKNSLAKKYLSDLFTIDIKTIPLHPTLWHLLLHT